MKLMNKVIMEDDKIEESVKSMVMRYGNRIWKMRVMKDEMKMKIRK
jgi:hypothetical protein